MRLRNVLTTGLAITLTGLGACAGRSPETTPQPTPQATTEQSPPTAQAVAQNATCNLVESGFGPQGPVKVRVETVATGLEVPWGIGFLPNGDMLVTERPGRVRLVQNGKLRPQPVATINVSDSGEGGLLGIAVHPDFTSNRLFYVYYTGERNGSPVNRVERWRLSQDGLKAARDRVILDNIPVALYHNGGRIRFGPDGMLYIGTGDARDPDSSQDVKSLAGKILRVTPDGQVPPDNPFPGNPAYITGIRNTQGFDWINASTLWVTDHGPSGELGRSGHDKASVAQAGANLGWPITYRCESRQRLVTPSIVWRQALPPGGASIYTGNAIPEWKGSTPIYSMLMTAAERQDDRPFLLIYASQSWDTITFREEIEALKDPLDLTVIHVLRKTHQGWTGETGYVDKDLLVRYIPVQRHQPYAR